MVLSLSLWRETFVIFKQNIMRASLLFVIVSHHVGGSVHGFMIGRRSRSSSFFFSNDHYSSHSYYRSTSSSRHEIGNDASSLFDSATDHKAVFQQHISELVNNCSSNDGKRRRLLVACISSTTMWPVEDAIALPGLPFFGGSSSNRRQLELCLVTILRTEYWAINISQSLNNKLLLPSATIIDNNEQKIVESDNQRKQPYLEARLGAKALVTQKIGGGANARVQTLSGLQLRECLDDVVYWCSRRKDDSLINSNNNNNKRICNNELPNYIAELIESLASIVEFDGLETTTDPSPRSSLMLTMYTTDKAKFVYRTLVEQVIPSCEHIITIFGAERQQLIEEYVVRDYSSEVPFEILERLYNMDK